MEQQPPVLPGTPLVNSTRAWFSKRALMFKVIGVGFLGLLLMIPLAMVNSTMNERLARQCAAVCEITQTWGRDQRIVGPVLIVPYTYLGESEEVVQVNGRTVKQKTKETFTSEAIFLPEKLEVSGALEPSARQRGIYTTHVYVARMKLSGRFARPDFSFIEQAQVQPQWERARVCVMVSDLRGVQETLVLKWDGGGRVLEPGAQFGGYKSGVQSTLKLGADFAGADFALDLTVNGSSDFSLAPAAKQTALKLTSSWPDPSFNGAFLPVTREVGPEGFNATWQVSDYGRNFPQQWTSCTAPEKATFDAVAFGVNIREDSGAYRVVERAIKYGVLFIALVFTTFFLFEALCGLKLNGLNYLLVGVALCLFFLGLLALSEFVQFGAAYAIAAAVSSVLIGLYSRAILKKAGRAWMVTGMLGGVYAYLFFVLRMEDFALLAGTAALFVVLGLVMFATRRISAEETAR